MDGIIREQRERIMAEARATVDRLRNLRPRERSIGDPIDPLAKWGAEAEADAKARALRAAERKADTVYKTHHSAAAPTPAPDTTDEPLTDEQEFTFAVVAEALGELDARHRAEIQSLKDEVADLKKAFFRTPHSMVESARELNAQTKKALAAVAKLHDASERELQRRSDPLDLPALPLRRPN